jgi:hypothetical protein
MTDVRFIHPGGEVNLRSLDVSIDADGTATVRALVDEADWAVIEHHDIFGARSRRRVPDDLTGVGEVRITIEGPEEALDTGWQPHTEPFVIIDAMRRLDIVNPQASGLEGEAWQGIFFTAAAAWSRVVDSLRREGFTVVDESDDTVQLRREDGLRLEVIALDESLAATVEVRATLVGFDPSQSADVLETLNAVNVAMPVSTNALDGDELLTKSGIPVLEGVDLPGLLEALAVGLVQVADLLLPPLTHLGAGRIGTADALATILD